MTEKLYRAEDLIEESGEIGVWVREYKVLSETPCGYWVENPTSRKGKKFVYRDCSRFAFSTIKAALESYRFRKKRELEHGIFKARKAKAALEVVNLLLKSEAEPEDYFGLLFRAPKGAPGISDVSVEVRT